MEVNSSDIQFLIGCSRREADKIIIDAMKSKGFKMGPDFKVKPSHTVGVSDIRRRLVSANIEMDGKNPVQNAIDLIKEYGLSVSMKKGILENIDCIYHCRLMGNYKVLERILPSETIKNICESLHERKRLFLNGGGKFPKKFKAFKIEDRVEE